MTGLKLTLLTLIVFCHAIQAKIRYYDEEQSKRKGLRLLKQMDRSQKNPGSKPTFRPTFAPTTPPSNVPSNSPSVAPPSAAPQASLYIVSLFPTTQSSNDLSITLGADQGQEEHSSHTSSESSEPNIMTPAVINVMELVAFTVTVLSQSDLEEVTSMLERSLLEAMRENIPNLLSIDLFVDKVEENRRRLVEQMKTVQYSGNAIFEGLPLPADTAIVEIQIEVLGDSKVIEKAGITQLKIGNTTTSLDSSSTSPPKISPKPPGFSTAVANDLSNNTQASGVLITFVVIGSLFFVVFGAFVGYRFWKMRSDNLIDMKKSSSTHEMANPAEEKFHDDEEQSNEGGTSPIMPNVECDDFSIDFSFDGESVVSSSVNSSTREAATKDEVAAYLMERSLLQSQRQQLLYRNSDDSGDNDIEFSYDRVGETSSDVSICATETSIQSTSTDCIEVGEGGETTYLSIVDNSYLASVDNILGMSAELEHVESEIPFDEMPFDKHVGKEVSDGNARKSGNDSHDSKRKKAKSLISKEVRSVEENLEEVQTIENALDSSPTRFPRTSGRRVDRKQSREPSRGGQEEEGLSSFLRERRKAKLAARMSET